MLDLLSSKALVFILQTEVHLIKKGDKVGASEATLLNMLKIYPFSYGLVVRQVYDNGSTYDPEILDITPDVLRAKFMEVSCNYQILPKISYFGC